MNGWQRQVAFRRFILPGIAFKAVADGDATGRECASFFMPFEPTRSLGEIILAAAVRSRWCVPTPLFARWTGRFVIARRAFTRCGDRILSIFEAAPNRVVTPVTPDNTRVAATFLAPCALPLAIYGACKVPASRELRLAASA